MLVRRGEAEGRNAARFPSHKRGWLVDEERNAGETRRRGEGGNENEKRERERED